MQEQWKPITGFEDSYAISNFGTVLNIKSGRILKPYSNDRGYRFVSLFRDNKCKKVSVHRLVASAFVPNPNGKKQVNHIDHDKANNKCNNLEWVTPQENTDHEIRSGNNKTRNSQLKSNSKYRNGKIQLTVLISKEENNKLEQIALETGHSRTRIIREALQSRIAEEET